MKNATKILRNRICLFFDFDGTLGPSTTKTLFDYLDIPYDDFAARLEKRQQQMWQYPLAKADLLRECSHREDSPLTRMNMEKLGREYPLFKDAEKMVDRLRKYAARQDDRGGQIAKNGGGGIKFF